jgi:hypothetical protein
MFINLHTIQYIIYILLLTYYRISNTDTINELFKQTKIKVVFDTKTHVSITFLVYCMQLLNLRLDFSKISQNDNDLGAEITKR